LIENSKPLGVVLTMEEYELLQSKPQIPNHKLQTNEIKPENPIGAAMVEEMNFPKASANLDDINLADADDVTLEDLGIDELPY